MKRLRKRWGSFLLAILLFCCALSVFAGCESASGSGWLSGTDVPETAWGSDGDMYLKSDDGVLYHKSQGKWNKIGSIKGDPGSKGADGVVGANGNGVSDARIDEEGHLILICTDGSEIDTGEVRPDAAYEISLSGGELTVTSETVIESLDSEAYGGKTFRQIFLENNLIRQGNMLNNDDISAESGWSVNAGTPVVDTETFASAPSSLKAAGTSSQQIRQKLGEDQKGTLFFASRVKVTRYVKGFAGFFAVLGNTNQTQGMKASVTDGFETATQVIEYGSTSCTIYMGTAGSANMDAFVDSAVLLNLSDLFETDLPDQETMTDLYEVFHRLYNGESNIVLRQEFTLQDFGGDAEITANEARNAFYDKVREKIESLGMSSKTQINSASGLDYTTFSTAQDLVRLGVHALGYDELAKVWNVPSYTVNTTGEEKIFALESTVVANKFSHDLTDHYYVLGGKTGSLLSSSRGVNIKNILAAVEGPDGVIFVGLTSHDGMTETEENNRYLDAKILFDIASRKYSDPNADISDLENQLTAQRACVVMIPPVGNTFHYDGYDFFAENCPYHLYSKNGEEQMLTASVMKTFTAVTALDYIEDMNEKFTVQASDIQSGSGPSFAGGEEITYRDALYLLMLPSSNTTAQALARVIGEKIITLGL